MFFGKVGNHDAWLFSFSEQAPLAWRLAAWTLTAWLLLLSAWIQKLQKEEEEEEKNPAVHIYLVPLALSPLLVERQGWKGQHGWQDYRRGTEGVRVIYGPTPVGLHHWDFRCSMVRVCRTDLCAAAATAWATAFITCNIITQHKPDWKPHWKCHIKQDFTTPILIIIIILKIWPVMGDFGQSHNSILPQNCYSSLANICLQTAKWTKNRRQMFVDCRLSGIILLATPAGHVWFRLCESHGK